MRTEREVRGLLAKEIKKRESLGSGYPSRLVRIRNELQGPCSTKLRVNSDNCLPLTKVMQSVGSVNNSNIRIHIDQFLYFRSAKRYSDVAFNCMVSIIEIFKEGVLFYLTF